MHETLSRCQGIWGRGGGDNFAEAQVRVNGTCTVDGQDREATLKYRQWGGAGQGFLPGDTTLIPRSERDFSSANAFTSEC